MSVLDRAVEMVTAGAPHVITSEHQLRDYTETLFALTEKEHPTSAELDTIDLLSLLITDYEARNRKLPQASPLEVLRFLMEQHNLTQRDLTPEFGSDSLVSRILRGERNLTLLHIHALAKRFGVPPSVFLGDGTETRAAWPSR